MKKNVTRVGILLALCLLTGMGCSSPTPVTTQPQPEAVEQSATWQIVDSGIERLSYTSSSLEAVVIMYRFDPKQFSFHFEISTSTKSMNDWSAAFPKASLIVNGVYFNEDNAPSGYFVSYGKRIGSRQFDLDKSGLIDVSDGVRILDTSDKSSLTGFANAAQSYPFYFKDGVPAIKTDTQKPARRSFIGKDKQGNVYLGVIPTAEISLFQTMLLLDEVDVDWANVINLDGGPSTGLISRARLSQERLPSLFPIPNIISVTRK